MAEQNCLRLLAAMATATIIDMTHATAGEPGRWSAQPMWIREWFTTLMQPDNPMIPCCGEADALEADKWIARADGSILATVTNGHGMLMEGTTVAVPRHKVKYDSSNPTGHTIMFYSRDQGVYCFIIGPMH